MNLIDHMRIFVTVARHHSFTAAATELNFSVPVVSRSVSRLESHLNALLLNRTTRQVSLTNAGSDFFIRCQRIIAGVDEAVQIVTDSNILPEGHLRVHSINEIGKRYIVPAIAGYRLAYPAVTFDLSLENRVPDLMVEDVDISIGIVAPDHNPHLVSKNVGASYSVLCASPDYLNRRGYPIVPEDLISHECLRPLDDAISTLDTWEFEGPYGPVNIYIPPSSFQLNTSDAILPAVCSGMGIGCVPAFIAAEALRDGRIVRVLPHYHFECTGLHAVYPARLEGNICVKTLIAYLRSTLPVLLANGMKNS